MRGVAACADFADGSRISGAQAGIAADPAACPRRIQAGFGAFGDQGSLELRPRPQHLKREHTLRGGRVDRVAQTAEMRSCGF
ncbi:MAG: hypothetical protein ABSC06_03650 [Rhodopila sp.]|jgi:hypothetical protein